MYAEIEIDALGIAPLPRLIKALLVKMKMAVRRRGSAGPKEETLTLLSISGENGVEDQLENPNANKTSIYRTISAEMTDKGYE